MASRSRFLFPPIQQRGVVLVVALLLLVILSLMAASSMRGAASSEMVSNTSRTSSLAMQAAEAALLYCEQAVKNQLATPVASGPYASYTITPSAYNSTATPTAYSPSYWDAAPKSPAVNVMPAVLSNTSLYQRLPECMAEYDSSGNSTVLIVARGFGPEVPVVPESATSRKPAGTEVWLELRLF